MTAAGAATTLLARARAWEPPRWLARAVARARASLALWGTEHGARCAATGALSVRGQGLIHVGHRVQFLGGLVPTTLTAAAGGVLNVGDDCHFNYGVTLRAQEAVTIGNRCMFGSHVVIADDAGGAVAPIRLGDDVWVAHGARIAPGVTVGDGAVISAGSVVTSDVPARSLALGRPARTMSLDLAVSALTKEPT